MTKVLEANALCKLADELYESMLKEEETNVMRYGGEMHYHYNQCKDAIAAVDLVKANESIMMLRYIKLAARVSKYRYLYEEEVSCRYLEEQDVSLVIDIKELIELYPEYTAFITQLLTELSTLGEDEDDYDEEEDDYDEDDEDEDEDDEDDEDD